MTETDGLIIARTGYTGEDGFEVFAEHNKIRELWKSLLKNNVAPCGLAARDTLRLEACYPLYGQELSQELSPLECGLKWTVKMDKADFIGKKALKESTPLKKLFKFQLEKGIPRSGLKIYDSSDSELGHVTSGTFSPTVGKGIAMGLIKSDKKFDDGDLLIDIRGKKYPAIREKKTSLNNLENI